MISMGHVEIAHWSVLQSYFVYGTVFTCIETYGVTRLFVVCTENKYFEINVKCLKLYEGSSVLSFLLSA
jgi:hypothetical protein